MKNKKGFPRKIGGYVALEELSSDSIGANHRAMEVEEPDLKPIKHGLLTELHSFLLQTPEEWNRANVLCQRIQDSGIPNFAIPKKIFKEEDRAYFAFPFIEGKTLAQIVEDASRKKKHIPFNLAFSISIAIASLIEMGASLAQGGQNFAHGFLTPDHIIFDYEGNIYLKYYGLWTILDQNETAVSEMIRMYAAWLTPEFIRREPINPRSDIYHLGYMIYRMLTGNYFSYLPGEDFQTTFTSISFVSDLPSTDISFLTNLIDFFKRTLNPDINKRFSSTKEFKNYVLKYFHSEEFSAFKTNLSTYMKSLYEDAIEVEKQKLNEELSNPPVLANTLDFATDESMVKIISGLEEKKRSKFQVFAVVAAIIVIMVIAGYFIADQINKTKRDQEQTAQLLAKQNQTIQDFKQKLNNLEVKKPDTTSIPSITTKPQEKDVKKIDDKKIDTSPQTTQTTQTTQTNSQLMPKPGADADKINVTPPQQIINTTKPAAETIEKKDSHLKVNEEIKEVKTPAPLLSLTEITLLPQKISGKEPEYPAAMRKTYVGRRATVKADLLIDENGNVPQVELVDSSEIPNDVQAIIKNTLKQWKFKPAQKGDMKVKVKWPVKFKIFFKADM